MSRETVYVALSQFCQDDDRPRRALLKAGFTVRENTTGRRIRREEMADALRDAEGVLAGVEPYDGELLAALPRLRCISRCGVGTDAIDMEAAERLNIAVLTTPDEVVEPVAQMTVAMIFALARNFPLHGAELRSGRWQKHTGYLLSEWTIGLVGFGRIGRAVECYLRPFGPRIVVADPYVQREELPGGVEMLELKRLLAEADLVSVHAARSPDRGPLLGRDEIFSVRPGSRIVNTSRGYLVDETALYEALRAGHVAAAALDVFTDEPYSGPLTRLPQVLCTPHVATLTRASRIAMELACAQNVVSFFSPVGYEKRSGIDA